MYSAAPITRLTQGAGLTAGGVTSVWSSGLQTLHVIVAVTSLFALALAMRKLLPARGGRWVPSPVKRADVLSSTWEGPQTATS
ncbi:hypothetical protein [Knoellia sp. LjRoot47]|uniref:hypothetical protein n=1 Tax=Knoellia sp. LjRoot47 TaxID=3342330 RepID=UPI003ECF7202